MSYCLLLPDAIVGLLLGLSFFGGRGLGGTTSRVTVGMSFSGPRFFFADEEVVDFITLYIKWTYCLINWWQQKVDLLLLFVIVILLCVALCFFYESRIEQDGHSITQRSK